MVPLYNELEYQNTKSEESLSCLCYNCNKPFKTLKKYVTKELNHGTGINKFCSKKCQGAYEHTHESINTNCANCNCKINIQHAVRNKSKSGNNFCSKSCAAKYNNCHKTHGTRRSKLEIFLEAKLINLYPNLVIKFNSKEEINSELDIYIPSYKLAFELNGIFHYEPIYGSDKLNQIQNNDNRKFQACLEHGIELCIINTSTFTYFKEKNALIYLNIITNIINNKSKNI